ncbi:MAG: A/G-specific adenine glycosylase [candidate division KSB1 bacterium]|nr:A/G-specific adenine glycosylase [candidate division KSB1 bacterium]
MRPRSLALMGKELVRWYRQHRRDLPWRAGRDPYRILVSEFMLQQTRVATVLPYFERFVARFPTVQDLASASLDEVLQVWAGLGYYRRARYLHEAARVIVQDYSGEIPGEPESLARLPGVGSYTAAAVASIAFGRATPVLDGNCVRVLCRLFRIRARPSSTRARRRLQNLARHLMGDEEPGDFNQALMELGATICLSRNPRCEACPLISWCQGHKSGRAEAFPARKERPAVPVEDQVAGVIWKEQELLIVQRDERSLLGGLWEFPGGPRRGNQSFEESLLREIQAAVGLEVVIRGPLLFLTARYSHLQVRLYVYHCLYTSGNASPRRYQRVAWVRPQDLPNYPMSATTRRIASHLLARAFDLDTR